MHLGVNIDHVATLRQARYAAMPGYAAAEPNVLQAARAAMSGGADSITLHVREDRRHMQDADAFAVRREIPLPLNLEMGATPAMLEFALQLKPDFVCLVPERRQEVTTEGGLDVAGHREELRSLVAALAANGSRVSMFIDPEEHQVEASAAVGAPMVELHTGAFANASCNERSREVSRLVRAAESAHALGLEVHAGHGIRIENLADLNAVPHLAELNIGHSIISHAVFMGLESAVREMKRAIASYRW